MTRPRITVVDITDRPDGTHEVLWSSGLSSIVSGPELAQIEQHEARAERRTGPPDAA